MQDGGKFSYPRALESWLESLVATLNESLHETNRDLHEVRLCLDVLDVFAIVLWNVVLLHKHSKHVDTDCLVAYSKHFTC